MGKYHLLYFDLRGRGEAIRYLLADQAIEYEETLIPMDKWRPEYKAQMEFGQVPCFRDGDFQIVQFNAIMRHLGRIHNLYGESHEEAAKIDMLTDHIEDLRKKYTNMIYQNYANGKAPYIDELPAVLQPMEKLMSENNAGKTGCCVGSKKSFLDYNMFDVLDIHLVLSPPCLDSFPALKAFHSNIQERPAISAHRQTDNFKTKTINYGPNQ